jgi:hypothetical protein
MVEDDGNDADASGVLSGQSLPPQVLLAASICAGLATLLSLWTIVLQLVNYRKPLTRS